MLQTALRQRKWFGGICSLIAWRVVLAVLLALVLPSVAAAYTIVMRSGGRCIEIPATFIVTRTTLTYEAAPSINITLQLANIDVAATEQINNEPAGTLLRRSADQQSTSSQNLAASSSPANSLNTRQPSRQAVAAAQYSSSAKGTRTLTNKDLEQARLARQASEKAYEKRRVKLGLPSQQDSAQQIKDEVRKIHEAARRSSSHTVEVQTQTENYWRARAAELRTEMAVVDAEIAFLRARLAQTSGGLSSNSFAVIGGYGMVPTHPGIFSALAVGGTAASSVAVNYGAELSGGSGFGGSGTRGHIRLNARTAGASLQQQANLPQQQRYYYYPQQYPYRRHYPSQLTAIFAVPLNSIYSSYDQAALLARLQTLEATRAGLQARRHLLDEEARRAGAPPGWLRL